METIQLDYQANLRYRLFLVNGYYYLLDVCPRNIIANLFFPLNWYQYHKVYLITKQDYLKIRNNHTKASKFVIPTSLVGGISVFLNSWLRVHNIDVSHYFDTNLSIVSNITLLALGTVLAYLSLQSFFANRKKNIQDILGKELGVPSYYQLRPQKPFRFFFSIFWAWLFLILLIIVFGIIFIYTGNLSFLLGFILMAFFYLGSVNGSFSTKEEWKYEIVDICPSYESNVK